MKKPRILFFVAADWYFLSHRLPLAQFLREKGYEVLVATPPGDKVREITEHGFSHYPIRIARTGMNPFKELGGFLDLVRIYRRINPDIVHHIALKPILYGGIAARVCRLRNVVNTYTGLGYAFTGSGAKRWIVRKLMYFLFRLGLRPKDGVKHVFQNHDDVDAFFSGVKRPSGVEIIPGSGVDLARYWPSKEPNELSVLFPARLLKDKGIVEYCEAFDRLRSEWPNVIFRIAGGLDNENPASISKAFIESYVKKGIIWLGHCTDMANEFRRASLVVLPSYREGLPKALLEAAACGRPIITTDAPGCREVVKDGLNGILVEKGNSHSLAEAIDQLLRKDEMRFSMGSRGLEIATSMFSLARVNSSYLAIYQCLLLTN